MAQLYLPRLLAPGKIASGLRLLHNLIQQLYSSLGSVVMQFDRALGTTQAVHT